MKLSIIVCTYNRKNYLFKLFNSLVNQSLDAENYEILIIDNNSTDNTESFCKEYIRSKPKANIRYIFEQEQGLSFAKNRGIKEATGDIVVFVDDDAFVNKDYIKQIFGFFIKNKSVAAVGGRIIPVYEDKPGWVTKFLEPIFGRLDMGDEIKSFKGNNFPFGGNSAVRKHIFEKYGVFNTNLGRKKDQLLASEEKDFFLRLKTGNETIFYLPEMILYHITPKERTSFLFIKNQAIGIGASEKIRAKNNGKSSLIKSYFKEIFKWGGSLILFFFYLITFKAAKGKILLMFRYWVSKGLFL